MFYPLRLSAVFKHYLWGGRQLKEQFHKETPEETIAESWELSCHPAGESKITNGCFAGMTLKNFVEKNPEALGTNAKQFQNFPVLIKLLASSKKLSIQVHPTEEYALTQKNETGKAEFWYILDAEPNAFIYYGLQKEMTRKEFEKLLQEKKVLDACQKIFIKPGDTFYIPSGTLHCIGKGITLLEVQQSSDTTYRFYDFDRRDANGNLRPLHIQKALDVLDFSPTRNLAHMQHLFACENFSLNQLLACEYFQVFEFVVQNHVELQTNEKTFHAITVIEKNFDLVYENHHEFLEQGTTIFLPANLGKYFLRGNGKFILTII